MTDITKLTDKINIVEKDLNTIKDVFAKWTPVVQDGGASLKAASATWSSTSIEVTAIDDIKDPLIKN
jgi:hypothetical protein